MSDSRADQESGENGRTRDADEAAADATAPDPLAEPRDGEADETEADETRAEQTRTEEPRDGQTEAGRSEAEQTETEETRTAGTGSRDTATAGTTADARPRGRKGLLLGLGGTLAVAAVVLALAAFVWPGFLAGPGEPDDAAAAAVSALAAKDAAAVDRLTCRSPDGTPTAQLAPQALELIQAVDPTGPPRLVLDTQAAAPVDLTLTAQGQTQQVPADVLLGVTDDEWCLNGIALRQ